MAVTVTDGAESVAELQTTADGQVVFLPAEYGDVAASYHVTAGDAAGDVTPDSAVSLTVSTPGGAEAGMPVDILFLLDVTGSMGDEIAQLKATIGEVADRLRTLPQNPDIRFGMTLFRDEGDLFVTSTFDFTSAHRRVPCRTRAGGRRGRRRHPRSRRRGVRCGTHGAVVARPGVDGAADLPRRRRGAPGERDRSISPSRPRSSRPPARGITVHVVAASQTDDPAEHAFREIAQGTGGRFVFLAYGAAGTATGPSTDIARTDYEELSLERSRRATRRRGARRPHRLHVRAPAGDDGAADEPAGAVSAGPSASPVRSAGSRPTSSSSGA